MSQRAKRRSLAALAALSAVPAVWLQACSPPPRPARELGQPAPTASTSAEPLWIRNMN